MRLAVPPCLLILLAAARAPAAPAAPGGGEAPQIFKNDWCFCLMPTITPETPASVSSVAYAAAALPGGRVAVAGTEMAGDGSRGSAWTLKVFGSDGSAVWTRRAAWKDHYYDVARALAVDGAGRIAVAGYAEPARGSPVPATWIVASFEPGGATRWVDLEVHPDPARAEAVAADREGRVTAAGWVQRGPNGPMHWVVRRYAPDGTVLWTRSMAGPWPGKHRALAATAHPGGGVVVAGILDEGGPRTAWLVRRYADDGALLWTRTFSRAESWLDEPYAVAVDADGALAVAGKVYSQTGRADWLVLLVGPDGELKWARHRDGSEHADDKPFALAFDPCGRILVGGFENGRFTVEQKPPYDAGTWLLLAYDRRGREVASATGESLGLAGGSAYSFAFPRTGPPVAVGFEKLPEVGKMRWVVVPVPALACR
jgi:hypothetical protein